MTWKRAYRWVSSSATWAVMSSQAAAGGARYSRCRRERSRLRPRDRRGRVEAPGQGLPSQHCLHPVAMSPAMPCVRLLPVMPGGRGSCTVTGRRKLAGPLWDRHSRGLTDAPGSCNRACSSLPAMRTTWTDRPPEHTALCRGTTGHPGQLPRPHLHADLTRLLSGSRGKCDLDSRMPRGEQQCPLWWHQAGVGHRA